MKGKEQSFNSDVHKVYGTQVMTQLKSGILQMNQRPACKSDPDTFLVILRKHTFFCNFRPWMF